MYFSLSISLFQFLPFNFSLSISLSNSLFLLSLFGRFSNHPLVCTYVPFRAGLRPSKPGLRQILPDLRPSQPSLRPSQPNRHRKSPHSTGLCPLLLLLSKRTKEWHITNTSRSGQGNCWPFVYMTGSVVYLGQGHWWKLDCFLAWIPRLEKNARLTDHGLQTDGPTDGQTLI